MTKYGVWNSVDRRFVFGIQENTKTAAWLEFCKRVPQEVWRKWRYEAKAIPAGWKNPPRECWR